MSSEINPDLYAKFSSEDSTHPVTNSSGAPPLKTVIRTTAYTAMFPGHCFADSVTGWYCKKKISPSYTTVMEDTGAVLTPASLAVGTVTGTAMAVTMAFEDVVIPSITEVAPSWVVVGWSILTAFNVAIVGFSGLCLGGLETINALDKASKTPLCRKFGAAALSVGKRSLDGAKRVTDFLDKPAKEVNPFRRQKPPQLKK